MRNGKWIDLRMKFSWRLKKLDNIAMHKVGQKIHFAICIQIMTPNATFWASKRLRTKQISIVFWFEAIFFFAS